MIGLCDCNNFFVSCERLFNPGLERRAVVVVGSNDGCVIARSNEAKALGIKMSQPVFQIRDLIQRNNISVISSNLTLYADISQRVIATLREELASIEVYSIDEAFLDLSQIEHSKLEPFARMLVKRIQRNVGMPVSIGIAPSKSLAKVATKLCKGYPKLEGICLMHRAQDIEKVLRSYPIGDVWGIGRRSVAMLNQYNIRTAQQFRETPQSWIQAKMGVVGLRTWRELWGESCIEIDDSHTTRGSIMISRTFHHNIEESEQLSKVVANFATKVCEKLRAQRSVARQMQVFIATNPHRTDLPQHNDSRIMNFVTPTDSTLEVVKSATTLTREMFRVGYGYKRAGVVLLGLSDNCGVQVSMFDSVDRAKHSSLMQTMDRLNRELGGDKIRVGAQIEAQQLSNRENRSPNYTTDWSDIITVKV